MLFCSCNGMEWNEKASVIVFQKLKSKRNETKLSLPLLRKTKRSFLKPNINNEKKTSTKADTQKKKKEEGIIHKREKRKNPK